MNHAIGLRDRLHDHVALDEIELYAELLIAVADADQQLSFDEIDRALGIAEHSQDAHEGAPVTGGPRCPEHAREGSDPRATGSDPRATGSDPRATGTTRPAKAPPRSAGTAPSPRPPDPRREEPQADLDRNVAPAGTGQEPIPLGPSTPWAPLQALGGFHTHHASHDPLRRRLAPWYI